jgi:hypothetical protein
MFVRFIVLAPKPRRPFGLFRAETPLLEDPELPHWLREPIESHYNWFNANLKRPFNAVSKRRRRLHVTALCWFRPEAQAHIARARHLACLIAEAGHPTAMIKDHYIGQIIYCDEAQVAAKPDAYTRLRA